MMKKITKLAGPALLMASLLTACGGGGGQSTAFTPTNITTQSQAEEATQSIYLINELTSLGENNVETLSTQEKKGLLKAVLKVVEKKTGVSSQSINCDIEGTVDFEEINDNSGYINFHQCKTNQCEILNGSVYVYIKDDNNTDIPEKVVFKFKKGFSYKDTCENGRVDINGDFSLILNGKLDNGDILTQGGEIKAEIILNGGDIVADDAGRRSLAHFYNLRLYGNEVDPLDGGIEYSINGGIRYKDDCLDEEIRAVFETIKMFREYANEECPYEGKLLVNEGQVTIEAYRNNSMNKIRVSLGNDVIFDNDCGDLENLGVCPE